VAVTEGTYTTQADGSAFNYTVPAESNRIGILSFTGRIAGTTMPTSVTATIGGVAMTEVPSSYNSIVATNGNISYWFYILDASMPAEGAQSVAVTVTGGGAITGRVQCMSIHSGAKQAAPTAVLSDTPTSGTVLNIPAAGTFAVTEGMLVIGARTVSATVTSTGSAGWTEKWDVNGDGGSAAYSAGYSRIYAAAGTDALVISAASINRSCGGAVLIDVPAAAGTVVPVGWNLGMSGGMKVLSGGMQ
jgi:hypothetical protein